MKPSGIEWIGDIPDDWEVTKIGQLYLERNEKVSDREYEALSVTKHGILKQLESAAKTDNGDNRKLVKSGDFVINSRSDRRGSCGISKFDGSVSLINIILRPTQKIANDYYNYLFRTENFADEFYKYGNGIVDDLWSTKWTSMKKILVPFPSLRTQQRIADYLDEKCGEIDATIAKQKESIEKLKAYKQSLISETVTKGLDKSAPLKPSGIKWLGEIPQNARIIRLRFLSSIQTGDKDTVNRVENGKYPFYVRSPIVERIDTFSFDGEAILMAGDGVGAGKVFHYVNGKFDYHQRVYNIHNLKGVLGKFLYYYLRENFYKEIEQSNAKSTVDSIRLPMLLDFPIIVYPYDLQKEMVSFLDKKVAEIDAIIIKKQNIIQKLDAYKKSLIFECVTGKQKI